MERRARRCRASSARWNEFVTPPLQYRFRLFRGMLVCAPPSISTRDILVFEGSTNAFSTTRTRRGKEKEEEREREWEGPNFIQRRASPRNLLPSKLQRGILPSPKDPAYLDEHGLLFPRRVFDRCLPGIKAVNGGGSAGYPPWRGWKVIGRDEGRCLRASSSEMIFERWNFVVDKTINKGTIFDCWIVMGN